MNKTCYENNDVMRNSSCVLDTFNVLAYQLQQQLLILMMKTWSNLVEELEGGEI